MAQVDFTPSPAFRSAAPKSKMTIYFALLIIALFAMMLACLFMYLEIRNLGGFGSVQGQVTAVEKSSPFSLATLARSASEGNDVNSLACASG